MTLPIPSRIILATDLTPAGDRAFDRAVDLAAEWNAELVVLHVVEASSSRSWGVDRRVRNARTEMDALLRSARRPCRTRSEILIGDPAERTLAYAREMECDFLVTGPAHGKIVGEKLLGSTAARMLRQSPIPVLAVRRRPEGPYRHIVAAVDFSDASRRLLLEGRILFGNAEFTLMHAYQIEIDWSSRNVDRTLDVLEAEERERIVQDARIRMEGILAEAGASGMNTQIVEGAPESVFVEYVSRNPVDLVIAGTKGHGDADSGSVGSVAEGLLTTLACDVLAVPSR